jgi:hypothetical protein
MEAATATGSLVVEKEMMRMRMRMRMRKEWKDVLMNFSIRKRAFYRE